MQDGGAVEQARAGHGRAVLLDGVAGGLDDARVAGQAEVVVGAEHEDALAVEDGLGALVAVERVVEGVHAHGLAILARSNCASWRRFAAIGIVVGADVERIDVERGENGSSSVIGLVSEASARSFPCPAGRRGTGGVGVRSSGSSVASEVPP